MKIKTFQALERMFGFLAEVFNGLRERCAVCPDCGRNRYTGLPCYIVRQRTRPPMNKQDAIKALDALEVS